MGKKTVCLWLALLLLSITAVAGHAFGSHFLGDVGKPADYDLTIKEFRHVIKEFDAYVNQLPSAYDWRDLNKVTPAKDQGNCGSCWAFASVGSFESKLLINRDLLSDLSEQQQVSCNTAMAGCNGGSMDALKFWQNVGPMEESCTGYPSNNGSKPACSDFSDCNTLDWRSTGYYTVNTASASEIKTSLYNDGPTYFRYDVYSDFNDFWNNAGPGAVYTYQSGNYRGGHAVLIIGWDDAKAAWLCKNSWGEETGPNEDGTFWIAYSGHAKSLRFGMANMDIKPVEATYSISGTIENAYGIPIKKVKVKVTGPIKKVVKTAPDGTYTVGGLGNGDYTIKPKKGRYTFTPSERTVTINGADLENQDFTGTKP